MIEPAPFDLNDEPVPLDEATAKARALTSDQFAAFRALMKLAGVEDNNTRDAYMTLMDASRRADKLGSVVRRFHAYDWVMELYRTRGNIPDGLSKVEGDRYRATLSKQWKRVGWIPIHEAQCPSHLGFFVREKGGKVVNGKRIASAYTDNLTDLVNETVQRARQFRGRRIDKFDRAAAEVLDQFRRNYPKYAPEWKPKEPPPPPPPPPADPSEESPTEKAEKIVKRAVEKVSSIAHSLPEDEARALGMALCEWANEVWTAAVGSPLPFPPVLGMVDNAEKEAPEAPTSCPSGREPLCEKPAENSDSPPIMVDKSVHHVTTFSASIEDEPRGVSLPEAESALAAFVGVGAQEMVVVTVDDTLPRGENLIFEEKVNVEQFRRNLPRYLKHNEENPTHSLTVRPRCSSRIIQVDDCSPEVRELLAPFAFMEEMTSPGNFQEWLALADRFESDDEFKAQRGRLLTKLKPTGANGGAHGSTRWPGSLNRKPSRRYVDGESPRVQLLKVSLGHTATFADLDAEGLLAPLPSKPTPAEVKEIITRLPGEWPDYDEALARTDRSRADYKFSAQAAKMGWPRHSIIARLGVLSPKATTRRDGYVKNTVDSAMKEIGLPPRGSTYAAQSSSASAAMAKGTAPKREVFTI